RLSRAERPQTRMRSTCHHLLRALIEMSRLEGGGHIAPLFNITFRGSTLSNYISLWPPRSWPDLTRRIVRVLLPPRLDGNSIDCPSDKPISAAPTGVRTEIRPTTGSASIG